MGLPKEHLTPRLESLPKDLRAKAEEIIKKKFGLDVKPKIEQIANNQESYIAFYGNALQQLEPRFMKPDVRYTIEHRMDSLSVNVRMHCRNCGYQHVNSFDLRSIDSMNSRYINLNFSCPCGRAVIEVDRREFYSRSDSLYM